MNSMVNTTLTSNSRELRCISSNALHSFQDLGDVVTAFKMHRSMKVSMNPAGDNIVASIPSAAAWSAVASMSTLYDQCPKVATAHNARRMVTVEIWVMNVLHMCAGLDRAQTKSSSVFRIKKDARLLITVTGPWRTRKDNASIMEVLLALWLECVLAPEKKEMNLGGEDKTKPDKDSSMWGSSNYNIQQMHSLCWRPWKEKNHVPKREWERREECNCTRAKLTFSRPLTNVDKQAPTRWQESSWWNGCLRHQD